MLYFHHCLTSGLQNCRYRSARNTMSWKKKINIMDTDDNDILNTEKKIAQKLLDHWGIYYYWLHDQMFQSSSALKHQKTLCNNKCHTKKCFCIDCLNNWLIDCLNNWLIDCLNNWLIDCLNNWLIDCLNNWLIGCLNNWLIDCLNNWLIDCLNNWLIV